MSKKTIIVLVVAAVAVYLLWKKVVFSKSGGKNGSTGSTGSTGSGSNDDVPTTANLTAEQIIARLTSVPADHKKYLRSNVAKIYADDGWKRSVQEKASNNGTTFEKQAVMDASWVVYRTGDNANAGWAKEMHEKLCAEVQAM